jgi:hypothetical protein
MRHVNNTENEFGNTIPSSRDEEYSSRSMLDDRSWVWEVSDDQIFALWHGITRGYLRWSGTERFLPLEIYVLDRMARSRSGVVLYPSQESRWRVSAYCFAPGPLPQLKKTAERVGVELIITRPEGTLSGLIDAAHADDAARQLMVLRTGPDQFTRRCRHRWPVEEGPSQGGSRTSNAAPQIESGRLAVTEARYAER